MIIMLKYLAATLSHPPLPYPAAAYVNANAVTYDIYVYAKDDDNDAAIIYAANDVADAVNNDKEVVIYILRWSQQL